MRPNPLAFRFSNLIVFLLLFGACRQTHSEIILDQERIRIEYLDGNFESVINIIGRFRGEVPRYSRADSLFIAKHLSVVYAANPSTVELGKYWMNEMLKVQSAADLVGMYVSEEIDRIFEKVRREYVGRQKSFGVDTTGMVLPNRPVREAPPLEFASPSKAAGASGAGAQSASPARPSEPAKEMDGGAGNDGERGWHRPRYWLMGGIAATMAVGVAAVLIASGLEDHSPDREVVIPRSPETP